MPLHAECSLDNASRTIFFKSHYNILFNKNKTYVMSMSRSFVRSIAFCQGLWKFLFPLTESVYLPRKENNLTWRIAKLWGNAFYHEKRGGSARRMLLLNFINCMVVLHFKSSIKANDLWMSSFLFEKSIFPKKKYNPTAKELP